MPKLSNYLLALVFYYPIGVVFYNLTPNAEAGWFCEQAASEKNGNNIMACGIGEGASEDLARKLALESAFVELDSICERSIDCRTFETLIEPQRNDCQKKGEKYRCIRAILAIITGTKRKAPFSKEVSNKEYLQKFDIVVRIEGSGKDLLPTNQGKGSVCSYDSSSLQKLMLDISSQEKQEALINETIKVPTSLECWPIHQRILYTLQRYTLSHLKYNDFLKNTLMQLEAPGADDRAYDILDYWQKLGPLDEAQWKIVLGLIERAQTSSLYRLLPKTIYLDVVRKEDYEIGKARLTEIGELAFKGKLGRPVPLTHNQSMELFIRSFKSYKNKQNPWAIAFLLTKYGPKIEEKDGHKIFSSLSSVYRDATDGEIKKQILTSMILLVNQHQPGPDWGDKLEDYLQAVAVEIGKLDDEEEDDLKQINLYHDHLKMFIAQSGAKLGESLALTKQDYQVKTRIKLCLDLKISCPNLIPDEDKLKKNLSSKKAKKRIESMEVLQKMPAMALSLEEDLFNNLIDGSKGDIDQSNEVIRHAAMALAGIPTQNKKILEYMVDLILRSRLHAQYIRETMGALLEPYWVKELEKGPERNQMMIMLELNEYKKLQKETCLFLEKHQQNANHYAVKDSAKRALLERCR